MIGSCAGHKACEIGMIIRKDRSDLALSSSPGRLANM